jgi:hypothetical protein
LKKFTFLAILSLTIFGGWNNLQAQKSKSTQSLLRCATMERLDVIYKNNVGADGDQPVAPRTQPTTPSSGTNNMRVQAVVTIPVVVHIVLPNPDIVTDADVQGQINRLNEDFAGLNPDSTNIPAVWSSLRGHSQIQFCLARRTPGGQLTNGIERRSSNTFSDITASTDPIKRTSQGGLDAWTPSQYLNIWVGIDGTGQGILGYAQFPGVGAVADDGVFLNAAAFGSSTCYTDPDFRKGRTGSHEVGHYLGLYHIWGDESGCTGDDFRQLPNVNGTTPNPFPLPAGLFNPAGQGNTSNDVGDTPNQGGATTNCPGGTATDACATASPGKMYQNHMDYSLDVCLSMFTNKQVARMEWVLANARAGLTTSLGCQPPAGAILWDASPRASVNPGGFELIGCSARAYTDALSCPGNIAPKFSVTNRGVNTITSLTVGYTLNNGTPVTQVVNVVIPTGGTYVASFPAVAVPVGNHTFKFFTSSPNGNADQVMGNDTLSSALRVMAPVSVPLIEGFETIAPFANFAIDNPDGDAAWVRTTPGRGTSAGKLSFNNYDVDTRGTFDDLRSAPITVSPTGGYSLSFDVAHKFYNQAGFHDTLSVWVSNNCGQTFTRVYQKWGTNLAGTAGSSNSAYTTPAAGDWRTETISLNGAILSSGQLIVMFRNSGRWGNYIHLDNINLVSFARDLRLVSINNPGTNSCSSNITPSVTVSNDGSEAVTSFKVGYRLDNGANAITTFNQTINPGSTATVTLPVAATTSGAHSITAFTADPVSASGTGDQRTANDTTSKTFSVVNLVRLPIMEGFETAFPPAGWTINNPNANGTWIRRQPGRNSSFSAFIDNYTVAGLIGQIDEMRLPFLNAAGADSVIVTFDVAHRNYPGSNDSLSVLATTDCGNSFSYVYSKAGAGLATGTSSTAAFTAPTAAQWRNERIALGGSVLSSGSLGFYFRNRNDYGNNTFIDNINITALFKRDLQLVSINNVPNLLCSGNVTPSVTVKNVGSETVTAFKVSYTVNGSGLQTQNVTGVSLARDAQTTVSLAPVTGGTPGSYTLRIYSFDPVTASGTGDLNTLNDSLTRTFAVPGTANAPLTETFVGTTFPPANWAVVNPDNNVTWSRNEIGNGNAGSAFVNTFNYAGNGQRDDLSTPIISYAGVDSVRLSFDLAAATYSYPGSTAVPIDTLEVLVTKDCGNTFTRVYRKWGNELQTINDPNNPQTGEFVPGSTMQWRRENLDLTQYAGQSPLQVIFRVTNNSENNIFIDNVNFSTQTLPAQLKQNGYVIAPTSFRNSFRIWHFQTPSSLRYVNVYNGTGQLVWSKQYTGNADRQMWVDLSGKAAGVYLVELGYTDSNRNVTQRVTKY